MSPIAQNATVASLLRIHPHFMRSVHLERDYLDPGSSMGYVLTPMAEQALTRIGQGFRHRSTQRAFRVAGDYGSGKSAFGLALARTAAGDGNIPRALQRFCGRVRLQPHLATGDNEPLGVTVLRALGTKASSAQPSTAEVLERVNAAMGRARTRRCDGVLIILDELGKNLEYAAQHPDRDDIFLLVWREPCARSSRSLVTLQENELCTGTTSGGKRLALRCQPSPPEPTDLPVSLADRRGQTRGRNAQMTTRRVIVAYVAMAAVGFVSMFWPKAIPVVLFFLLLFGLLGILHSTANPQTPNPKDQDQDP